MTSHAGGDVFRKADTDPGDSGGSKWILDCGISAIRSFVGALCTLVAAGGTAHADCVSPANAIEAENCKTGNPSSEWDISGAGDANLQGFATDISVNRGGTISFKIDTTASAYHIDIYRLGYYNGLGARKVATIPNSSTTKTEPAGLPQRLGHGARRLRQLVRLGHVERPRRRRLRDLHRQARG